MNKYFYLAVAFFLFLLIVIYSSSFFKDNTIINKFVMKIPIASHFIIGLGVFLTYLIFTVSYKMSLVKSSDETDKEIFIGIFDTLEKHKEGCPNLINSFFFEWQYDKKEGVRQESRAGGKGDDKISHAYVANFIFQSVEVFCENVKVTDLSDSKFMCFFSQFYKSQVLKLDWDKYSASYSLKPRLLIEELFKINETNTFKSADELREYFEKYVFTDRYQKIMHAVDKTAVGHEVMEL